MRLKKLLISCGIIFLSLPLGACNVKPDDPSTHGLQSIEVKSESKTQYTVGEGFTTPIVIASYNDATTKDVSNSCNYTGFTTESEGQKTVNVSYTEGEITKTTSYTITVSKPASELTKIEVTGGKTSYKVGDQFVKPTVTATFSDQSTRDVSNDCTYTGFDSTTAGTKIINVGYTSQSVTKTTTYQITVTDSVVLSKIEVTNCKTQYTVGDQFVKPTVTATFSDQSTEDVSNDCEYTGFDSSTTGTKTINVSYTSGSVTKTTSYDINVSAPKALSKIEVTNYQEKYIVGDSFKTPTVIATYDDSSTLDVSNDCTYTGFDSTTTGTKTINVSYTSGSITKTTSFTVTVEEEPVTGLKYALFADVQLCNDVFVNKGADAAVNLGATANAPIALKNHLEFCKKENISVILMNGDITNQANEYYYQHFEKIVTSVYGSDKTKWPEFVCNMGNHEWWWGVTEKETGDAVSMFRKYARIESDNLVAQSQVPYSKNTNVNVPSYYKVINGVPFIVISAESSAGNVGTELKNEITGWLNQAKLLRSVQAGGPIFVEYHYPLTTSMTHGQGSNAERCTTVEEIFKDTPNAVIFTGDTHYPGISERAINQVNFTTINIGSSSYSRMVSTGATKMNNFYNLEMNGGKTTDKMVDQLKFNEAYTPTIQIIDVKANHSFTVDRYFSEDGGNATKVGPTWTINPIKTKADFTYTNDRFEKVASAQALYGKDGLDWENDDAVTFGVNGTQATVKFPDVIDYHCCEHYLIDINGQKYDVASNYYKNLKQRGNNYYVLENVTSAASYTVTVTAYDFYDNPSTKTLTSTTNDPKSIVDPVDHASVLSYCDIQTRNNFDVVSPNKDTKGNDSNSSTEFYYKGIQTYGSGAILNRIYLRDKSASCKDYLSISDTKDIKPTVIIDVKNLGTDDLIFGLSVVKWNTETSKEEWQSDFGNDTQKSVTGNDWTTLTWDLSDFEITCKEEIANITLKCKSKSASSSGYEMNVLVDNIDICDSNPYAPPRGKEFMEAANWSTNFKNDQIRYIATDNIIFDVKFTSAANTKINIMVGGDPSEWSYYYGYYCINANGTLGDNYSGVSIQPLADGYYRITMVLSELNKTQEAFPNSKITLFYIRGNWSNASGYIDIQAK